MSDLRELVRFDDDTTVQIVHDELQFLFERAAARGELTQAQECLGSAIALAVAHPDSQTAVDLLAWVHGSTPASAFETARADTLEAWIATEDMPLLEALDRDLL